MNSNIKEIGHVSFKLKDVKAFRNWYENVLGLNVGFILQKNLGEDYIIYYQLHKGQFIEIFPENSFISWADYDGHNNEELYSYQYSTLGTGSGELVSDPEGNKWQIGPGDLAAFAEVYGSFHSGAESGLRVRAVLPEHLIRCETRSRLDCAGHALKALL